MLDVGFHFHENSRKAHRLTMSYAPLTPTQTPLMQKHEFHEEMMWLSANFRVGSSISQAPWPNAKGPAPPSVQSPGGSPLGSLQQNKPENRDAGSLHFLGKHSAGLRHPTHLYTFYRSPGCFIKIELMSLKPAFSPESQH